MDADDAERRRRNSGSFPEIESKPRPGTSKPVDVKLPKLYLHATKDERNLPLIHREGLKAGASQGIGNPDDPHNPKPFPGQVFVAKQPVMKFVGAEAPGGNIGVISGKSPEPDPNYTGGKLELGDAGYFFTETIRPLRDVQHGHEIRQEPFSLTFPMTPRTATGARKVLEHMNPGKAFTDLEAKQQLAAAFKSEFTPLYIESTPPSSPRRGRSPTRSTRSRDVSPEQSRSPSPSRTRSPSLDFDDIFGGPASGRPQKTSGFPSIEASDPRRSNLPPPSSTMTSSLPPRPQTGSTPSMLTPINPLRAKPPIRSVGFEPPAQTGPTSTGAPRQQPVPPLKSLLSEQLKPGGPKDPGRK